MGGETARVVRGSDSLWVLVAKGDDPFVALRAAYFGETDYELEKGASGGLFGARSLLGDYRVAIDCEFRGFPTVRLKCWLTPRADLLNTNWPRDLFPVGPGMDPMRAGGKVEAAQRGLNSGLLFLHMESPKRDLLYWQDLTSLNPFFEDSGTKPDGAVGGHWPELGFQLPQAEKKTQVPARPIRAGVEYQVADTLLCIGQREEKGEQALSQSFIRLAGRAFDELARPATEFRDWPRLAEQTLRDLNNAPTASVAHYGHRYAHPYNGAEYPDIMCQCTLGASVAEFGAWKGKEPAFVRTATAGLRKFYDPSLRTLRRYLPNVGKDKDRDAVDSWYLYHPLVSLGRLARLGHGPARRLLLDSVDYGIKVAHHFHYRWPIQFKVDNFDIITRDRGDGSGQTDVGGLYAYSMLQLFEITNDKRFVDEARNAIDAAQGMRFELNYQANLTAWGAAACLRLWRITAEQVHLRQSYIYLASFFHNCAGWESEIGLAKLYRNFLGATALHDAPYMAMFECMDSFAAFEEYLRDTGPDVDRAAVQLVTQYCKYALDRAWFYFPKHLPAKVLAKKDIRNGSIDRKLAFPVEDLYVDGQPAGQVGQEIYGAGAAFIFASRCFHRFDGAPFAFFCDHFLMSLVQKSEQSLEITPIGVQGYPARLRVMKIPRRALPKLEVIGSDGPIGPMASERARWIDHEISGAGPTIIQW